MANVGSNIDKMGPMESLEQRVDETELWNSVQIRSETYENIGAEGFETELWNATNSVQILNRIYVRLEV